MALMATSSLFLVELRTIYPTVSYSMDTLSPLNLFRSSMSSDRVCGALKIIPILLEVACSFILTAQNIHSNETCCSTSSLRDVDSFHPPHKTKSHSLHSLQRLLFLQQLLRCCIHEACDDDSTSTVLAAASTSLSRSHSSSAAAITTV